MGRGGKGWCIFPVVFLLSIYNNAHMTTTAPIQTPSDAQLAEQLGAFGEKFKQVYERARRSKRAIAASVSLDRAGITKIERGRRAPNMSTLLELARAVGTTPAELLSEIGPKPVGTIKPELKGRPPRDPYERLAANLRWARERTSDPHLTQADLAWEAKVDRSSLSGYETGRLAPNLRTLLKLSGALGLAPSVLLDGVKLK